MNKKRYIMISKRVLNLNPYVPGEQPKDRTYIKINANENPYPPSKKVFSSIKEVLKKNKKALAVYPDPESFALKNALAKMLSKTKGFLNARSNSPQVEISPEMIFCGNGSDEVLSFVFYAFFNSDSPLVLPEHTYSFYPVYASYYAIELEKIPLKEDFRLDSKKMVEVAKTQNASGMIFANPNAPTSLALSTEEIREMLLNYPKDKVFVVDEAYVDFANETALPLLNEFPNLVIIRTFSKSFSFAGMRMGYAIANPPLIEALARVKNSFNHFPVDALTQVAGIASSEDFSYYQKNTSRIIKTREKCLLQMQNLGWTCLPSKTNFILAKKEGYDGKVLYEKIKEQGFLVRHFDTALIKNYVRISIGSEKEMDAFLELIKKF